ncbi:MAG: sulfite exporter TauE/SafE family protein [Flavobacteriales bacterium]|nr:sulfite exporter TauE/SafE family protein [Flavobacteriales bacterium]
MYLLVAISIGLFGSLHCLGMCGPILLAVNQGKGSWQNDLLHHAGRLSMYMVFGMLAGALGQSFDAFGYQQSFSLIIGALLILSVLIYPLTKVFKRLESTIGRISIRFSGWIHRAGIGRSKVRFLMGIANGILPCGMVYLGVAGAASTFTPWDGAIFMLAFGAGTLPALLLVSRLSQSMTPKSRSRFRKLIPITIFLMGGLLIVRGMNLGVPYLSPKARIESNEISDCR